jgi:hypothetical protein
VAPVAAVLVGMLALIFEFFPLFGGPSIFEHEFQTMEIILIVLSYVHIA